MTFFVFEIAGHAFGLPVESVLEVLPMAWVTPVPESPADVVGVLDVRGALVPVIDPAPRLGRASRAAAAADFLVLVAVSGATVALRVDAVQGLVSGAQEPVPKAAEGPDFVAGHLRTPGALATVLALSSFLRPEVREFAARAAQRAGDAR